MSAVERDDKSTQLGKQNRDILEPVKLRAVVDPIHEEWLALDHPDHDNEEEWLESDTWVQAGDWR